jgi:AraC-like DNA-binding protein
MLAQDPLNLQRVQLKTAQEWSHKGEQLSFIFPKAGAGNWVAGAAVQKIGAGDVLVLNAALGGKICAAGPGEMVFWCISLQLEHLFPLFESSEICLLQTISDGFKTARLYPAAIPVAKECHRWLAKMPPQGNLDHRCHLLQVVAAILTGEFNRAKSQRVGFIRPEQHMVQVFEKLTASELLNLSVGELADKFACSRRHLSRLFHHYFGMSVAALRMEMRLLKSVTLLRDPDTKVIRVAEDCGFNQLGLFNICFKRRFGASPGQWRKLNLKSGSRPDHLHLDAATCPLQVNGICPMSGNNHQKKGPLPLEVLPAEKPGPARRLLRAIDPNRSGKLERRPAISQPGILKRAPRRIVVRINA